MSWLALAARGAASLAAAASLALTSPEPAAEVEFLAGSQTLLIRVPAGVVPTLSESKRPPSLTLRLPGAVLAPGRAGFATGQVANYAITGDARGSVIVLGLRAPLSQAPALSYYAGRMIVSVVPALAPRVEQLVAPAIPSAYPTARVAPTPLATSSPLAAGSPVPTPRITPVPMRVGPLPVPGDIPPIQRVGP